MNKQEYLEQQIGLLETENKQLRSILVNKESTLEDLRDKIEKYKQKVIESNNRLTNFDQLFRRLAKDITRLNEMQDLVILTQETAILLDEGLPSQIIPRYKGSNPNSVIDSTIDETDGDYPGYQEKAIWTNDDDY